VIHLSQWSTFAMSRLTPSDPIAVRVGDCLCEGSPHADGDFVYLDAQLSLDGGLLASAAMAVSEGDPQKGEHDLGFAYLLGGISGWNFLDDDGKPIAVNPDTIRRALPWGKGGRIVAEKANKMYFDQVIRPLVEERQALSVNGVTDSSTSRAQRRKAGTRKRLVSSSPATSLTVSSA
jgi:hypothetical protein